MKLYIVTAYDINSDDKAAAYFADEETAVQAMRMTAEDHAKGCERDFGQPHEAEFLPRIGMNPPEALVYDEEGEEVFKVKLTTEVIHTSALALSV